MEVDLKFVMLGVVVAIIVAIIIVLVVRWYNTKFNSLYYITDASGYWVYDASNSKMTSIENIKKINPISIVSYGDKIYLFDKWWNVERVPENGSIIPYQENKLWLKTGVNGIQEVSYTGDFGYNIEDGMIIKKADE